MNSYFTNQDVDYICEALQFVAKYGWLFLANYNFETKRKLWISKDEKRFSTSTRISDIDFVEQGVGQQGNLAPKNNLHHLQTMQSFQVVKNLPFYLEKAHDHLMDMIEKLQYENHNNFNESKNQQSQSEDSEQGNDIWWLETEQALQFLLTLKSNSVDACDDLCKQLMIKKAVQEPQ